MLLSCCPARPGCPLSITLLNLTCRQIGFPLQYNQYPLLRALWNIRFMAQVRGSKVVRIHTESQPGLHTEQGCWVVLKEYPCMHCPETALLPRLTWSF
jgi:hypothetical protein